MTLQDDIARYIHQGRPSDIAADIIRDYYLVPLADLPEVKPTPNDDTVVVDGTHYYVGVESGDVDHRRLGLQHLALAAFHEARESEAAALARRRDAVAGELEAGTAYEYLNGDDALRKAIDRIIELEAQVSS